MAAVAAHRIDVLNMAVLAPMPSASVAIATARSGAAAPEAEA